MKRQITESIACVWVWSFWRDWHVNAWHQETVKRIGVIYKYIQDRVAIRRVFGFEHISLCCKIKVVYSSSFFALCSTADVFAQWPRESHDSQKVLLEKCLVLNKLYCGMEPVHFLWQCKKLHRDHISLRRLCYRITLLLNTFSVTQFCFL